MTRPIVHQRSCSVEGCAKPSKTRGYCGMHAERVRQYGLPGAATSSRRVCSGSFINDGVGKIYLGNGIYAIVDETDFALVDQFLWYCSGGYAVRIHKRKSLKIHQIILGKAPSGFVIDHINRNPLDNRRCNLRFVSHGINHLNADIRSTNSASGYRGVLWNKKIRKWRAVVKIGKKQWYIGSYAKIEDAVGARLKYIEDMTGLVVT